MQVQSEENNELSKEQKTFEEFKKKNMIVVKKKWIKNFYWKNVSKNYESIFIVFSLKDYTAEI